MMRPRVDGGRAFSGKPPALVRQWPSCAWIYDIDTRSILPAIRVPTLILHRTEDRMVTVEHARYLARHIPGARYVELPGKDHFYFTGDADAYLDQIEEFLTGERQARESDRVLATGPVR